MSRIYFSSIVLYMIYASHLYPFKGFLNEPLGGNCGNLSKRFHKDIAGVADLPIEAPQYSFPAIICVQSKS